MQENKHVKKILETKSRAAEIEMEQNCTKNTNNNATKERKTLKTKKKRHTIIRYSFK